MPSVVRPAAAATAATTILPDWLPWLGRHLVFYLAASAAAAVGAAHPLDWLGPSSGGMCKTAEEPNRGVVRLSTAQHRSQ